MKTFILTIFLVMFCFSTASAQPFPCTNFSFSVDGVTIPNPVPYTGGTYSLAVHLHGSGAQGCICIAFWNITSPSWITCDPSSSGCGDVTVNVTILPSNTVRTGSILVRNGHQVGVTITINQAGNPAPPITCQNISLFQARCQPGGLIQARVTMTDTSHTGDEVGINIDENAYTVMIGSNGKGLLSQTGFNPGAHIVELADPSGCFPPITVTCSTGLAKDGDDSWDGDESWEIPSATVLLENYPDPFNPSTTIRYALSEDTHVTLKVYNMLGQLVATLADELQFAGYQQTVWDGSNDFGQKVASGVYIYRITVGSFSETKRMLLLK